MLPFNKYQKNVTELLVNFVSEITIAFTSQPLTTGPRLVGQATEHVKLPGEEFGN